MTVPTIEELKQRYIVERDKRVRADGNDQYVSVDGAFARFADDPYTEPTPRASVVRDVDVAIVGGGFGGLVTAVRLRDAGLDDLVIIESGGDVGGTWYWNRYPGAQCDVESYIYLPLLEETGYVPTERYAHADEILEHCRRIAERWDLYRRALLSTSVSALVWSAERSRWIVTTDRGDELRARFVVTYTGPMSKPKLPGIPGIERFRGHAFHTSRWDYAYTGGSARGALDKLRDKSVAVIGTGATAVQCIPYLAEACDRLYVVQRTPSSIDVRGNAPTDPAWVETLEPGWQRRRMESFTALTSGALTAADLVGDQWTDVGRRLLQRIAELQPTERNAVAVADLFERVDFEKMDELRQRIDEVVTDRATADRLKPWYRIFCKRPCFHDSYLDAFNRPNVELVDTDGKGVERITPYGFVVDGVERTVDCLIFATGFEVGTDFRRRAGFDVTGTRGTLAEHWADGVRTLHGLYASGFPNLFVFGQGQGAFAVNYQHLLLEAANHVTYVVSETMRRGSTFHVRAEAEDAWVAEIVGSRRGASTSPGGAPDCTPGYYNNEGRPAPKARQGAFYGAGPLAYFDRLAAWRDAGNLDGLEVQ